MDRLCRASGIIAASCISAAVALYGCGGDGADESGATSEQSSSNAEGDASSANQAPDSPPPAKRIRQWFTDVTDDVGLDFVHETGARGGFQMPEIMCGGAALFDADGDGDLDAYFTNGSFDLPLPEGRNPTRDAPPLEGRPVNQLYLQQDDGRFVNATERSGLGDDGYGMGVAIGDIDNDGDADLYVTNYGADRLYRNSGDGSFVDVTDIANVAVDGWSSSAAFFDYDRDGYLDLFVTRYLRLDPTMACADLAGRPDYCGPKSYPGEPDVLLHNNGDGTFTDVSAEAGMASMAGAGLGVVCEDFNDDGLPDVYVANDGDANHLWLNRGEDGFEDVAIVAGVALDMHGHAEAGMGVVAADFDGDGDTDLFMTHLANETNTLYTNRPGELGFEDASGASGLGASSRAYTGFGIGAFDAEQDGDLDVLVVNGRVLRAEPQSNTDAQSPWDRYAEPNLFYVNDGDGRFTPAGNAAQTICARIDVTRGLALGDVDGDGDQDILITNAAGRARLYRNDAPREGNWLSVRAVDPDLNRDAIGARVVVRCGDQMYVRTITRAGSYCSSNDVIAHFGLGGATVVDAIAVRWSDGEVEQFSGVDANRAIVISRGVPEIEVLETQAVASGAEHAEERVVAVDSSVDASGVPMPDVKGMEPRVREAIETTRRRVLDDEKSAEAWWLFAAVCDAHALAEPARMAYRRSAALAPDSFRTVYNLAIVEESLGADSDESIVQFRKAASLRPDYAAAHLRLGDALARYGRLTEARGAYRDAIRVDPELGRAHRGLGQTLLSLNEPAAAMTSLTEALRLAPGDGPTMTAIARVHAMLGDDAAAARFAEAARDAVDMQLFADPERRIVLELGVSSQLCRRRGLQRMQSRDYAGAMRDFAIVVEVEPDSAIDHYRLGYAAARARQLEFAETSLKNAIELDRALRDAYVELGLLYMAMQRFNEAAIVLGSAIDLNPNDAVTHWMQAMALARAGRLEEAIPVFELANNMQPRNARGHMNWGTALMQSGEAQAAADHFQTAIEIEPNYALAHFNLGVAKEKLNRTAEAIEHYRAAIAIDPQSPARQRLQALGQGR